MLSCDGVGDGDVDGKWQWQKVNKSLQIFAWVVHGARGRGLTEGGKGCRKTAEHNAQARADAEAEAEAAIGIGKG